MADEQRCQYNDGRIRQLEESAARSAERDEAILRALQHIKHAIDGNGREGITARIARTETWQRVHTWVLGGISTGLLALVGWLLIVSV